MANVIWHPITRKLKGSVSEGVHVFAQKTSSLLESQKNLDATSMYLQSGPARHAALMVPSRLPVEKVNTN